MIKKVFPILALAIFSSMLGAGIVVPLLPLYAESMGATGIYLGVIFSSFAVANTVSIPVFGRLSDRSGRKILISIGLFFYTILSLGFVWADSVAQLTLVRMLQGAAGGMVLPIAQAYIGDVCPEGEEGKWMGYANASFFTGFGFGPLMGGILAEHFGMDSAFFAMSGLNLLAFLIVTIFLPGIRPKQVTAKSGLSFRKLGASGMLRGLFSFNLTFALGRAAFMVFLPVFAADSLGLNPADTGILVAANVLLTSLFGIPLGRLADLFSRRALVVVGAVTNVAFLAIIPLSDSFWQLFFLCVLGSISAAVCQPAASALTLEEGRKFGMGSAIALYSIAFSLGMAIGPILTGVLRDFAGVPSVFYFGAAMLLVGAFLFISFTRSTSTSGSRLLESVTDETDNEKRHTA